MWRWSSLLKQTFATSLVFSTYVEVILPASIRHLMPIRILHVCGGDPQSCCFLLNLNPVFSTYVEVILSLAPAYNSPLGILHVCGGDPIRIFRITKNSEYSPRMWRWSRYRDHKDHRDKVFSTYVEVILSLPEIFAAEPSILHVCGGDPNIDRSLEQLNQVFSTYVEVILLTTPSLTLKSGILHVCGGDPWAAAEKGCWKPYSPRMWRWSQERTRT